MTHTVNTSPHQAAARQSGAAWREHLVDGSAELREAQVPLVWSRLWLRRRLRARDSSRRHSAQQ